MGILMDIPLLLSILKSMAKKEITLLAVCLLYLACVSVIGGNLGEVQTVCVVWLSKRGPDTRAEEFKGEERREKR